MKKMLRNLVFIFGLVFFVDDANAAMVRVFDANVAGAAAAAAAGQEVDINQQMINSAIEKDWYQALIAINNGADIKLLDESGEPAFFNILELDGHISINDLLMMAARNDLWNAVIQLISCGAYINTRDSVDGMTVLHCAIEDNREDVVKLLLELGACINIRTKCGQTPLDLAYSGGVVPIAKLLIVHHASPELTPRRGAPGAPAVGRDARAHRERVAEVEKVVLDAARFGVLKVDEHGTVHRALPSLIILAARTIVKSDQVDRADLPGFVEEIINIHRF